LPDPKDRLVKKKDFKDRLWRNAGLLAFAGCLAWHSGIATADTRASLDGTWKRVPGMSRLVPVGGGTPPFTKQGRSDYKANKASAAKGDFDFDQTRSTCSSPGLPRLMVIPDRFRVFQRERAVTMLFEWNNLVRQVDLRAGPQERPPVDSMIGFSQGHWEGDTLVAKTVGFLPGRLLDDELPGSEALELLERIRLEDKDTLEDLLTITDTVNYSRSWQAILTYTRQPDGPFPEDLCLDRKAEGRAVLPH
jgi:hypothetical protein